VHGQNGRIQNDREGTKIIDDNKKSYKKKQWRPPSKKTKEKTKPEEQEGMPQRQHY
jgi:hypothetical protein